MWSGDEKKAGSGEKLKFTDMMCALLQSSV